MRFVPASKMPHAVLAGVLSVRPYLQPHMGADPINFIVRAMFAGSPETDTFGWYGSFILVYFLCSISAPIFLKKIGKSPARTSSLESWARC